MEFVRVDVERECGPDDLPDGSTEKVCEHRVEVPDDSVLYDRDAVMGALDEIPVFLFALLQPLFRSLEVGDIHRHAEQAGSLAGPELERDLGRLEEPDVPLRVREGLGGDDPRFPSPYDGKIVLVEVGCLFRSGGKIGVSLSQSPFDGGAVGVRDGPVHQEEPALFVFGEHKVRDEIDDLAEKLFAFPQCLFRPDRGGRGALSEFLIFSRLHDPQAPFGGH